MCDDSDDEWSSEEEAEIPYNKKACDQLRSKFHSGMTVSKFGRSPVDFATESLVNGLITRKRVASCLTSKRSKRNDGEDCDNQSTELDKDAEVETIIDFVMKSAPKAFATAITAKINPRIAMVWFRQNGMDDNNLPIGQHKKLEWTTRNNRNSMSSWRNDFFEKQWTFFAPVFSTRDHTLNWEEARILPFITEYTEIGRGSFGTVSRSVVHEDHIDIKPKNSGAILDVAVKEITARIEAKPHEVAAHWEKEVKALRRMNDLNQEHIVRFITAFRRRKCNGSQEHYLMFEFANGGNLHSLWQDTPFPILTASLVREVVEQLLGLAKALDAAHNLNTTGASYRHGDLKPENILRVLGNGLIGTLKIGDWGEAREHGVATELRFSGTIARHGTRRYEPPEVVTKVMPTRDHQSPKRRTRLYDIWAMGCIVLEFLIWLLYGRDELKKFEQEFHGEPLYQTSTIDGRTVARVHAVAQHWMNHMAQDPRCKVGQTAIGDLLEVVRGGLLVVKLPRRLGTRLSLEFPDAPRGKLGSRERGPTHRSDPPVDVKFDANQSAATRQAADIPSIILTQPETQHLSESLPPRIIPEHDNLTPAPKIEREARGPERCLTADLCHRIDHIASEDETFGYWYSHGQRYPAPKPYIAPISTTEPGPYQRPEDYAPPELDENDWSFQSDNDFARAVYASLDTKTSELHDRKISTQLCIQCTDMQDELWTPGFSITVITANMVQNANNNLCDLCRLLWQSHPGPSAPEFGLERLGSDIHIVGDRQPVLSIVNLPHLNSSIDGDGRVGLVELPKAGEETHLAVIRYWLNECDANHTCHPDKSHSTYAKGSVLRMPTRLIEVGREGDEEVRLVETGPQTFGQWVALSHMWGEVGEHFSTVRNNLQQHLKGIKMADLPATFTDAVKVTRALGCAYLWIDSLCIVQGPEGDFRDEAKRMEDVYSGAYCVIAASSANHHNSGFLKSKHPQPRDKRNYVGFNGKDQDEHPYFICQTIDNFKLHVLDGALNRRGWVYQEHALARRTLFFTEHQTYFECGEGVRCETSTRLKNQMAAFLGDPDFPNILSNASRGGRIFYYQMMFRKYSTLGLTASVDRPIAIDGLQQRLLEKMQVKGGFGIFDEGESRGLLRRSLLWIRSSDEPSLSRIDFSSQRALTSVPSWSWMAYTGAIDYLQPDFGSYVWEDLQSPWSTKPNDVLDTDDHISHMVLNTNAYTCDPRAAHEDEGELVFDDPVRLPHYHTTCIILGKAKGSTSRETQRHFVLIIKPVSAVDQGGRQVYERIGAGYLPGKCISPNPFVVSIH